MCIIYNFVSLIPKRVYKIERLNEFTLSPSWTLPFGKSVNG